ncbi:MAG: ribosome-binding factor A [bacterium]|nr:ribosome-binding factor A [bacterium]
MESDGKRENRISARFMTLAAEFLARESAGHALLTVTGISASRDNKNVTVLITVFPDKYEEQALSFAKRQRSDFREYVKVKAVGLGRYPIFDFAIDMGEKNRQHIDSLIQKTK